MLAAQLKSARDPWQDPDAWLAMSTSKRKTKPSTRKGKLTIEEALATRRPLQERTKPEPLDIVIPPTVTPFEAGYAVWEQFRDLKQSSPVPVDEFNTAVSLAHFLTKFVTGRGNPGDAERLRRMSSVLHQADESRRALAVQLVRGALSGGWPPPESLAWALTEFVDPAFAKLDGSAASHLARNPGRKGASAIAAELSIRCNAFGDRGEAKAVAARFDQAWRALKS